MENENYIKKGLATRVNDGIGGNLYLTSNEIVFKGHPQNYNNICFSLETISSIKLTGINIIEIHLKDERVEKYRVYGRNSWEDLINKAIKDNVKPFDESKEFLNNEDVKLYEDELIINNNIIKFNSIKDINVNENIIILTLNSNNQIKIKTINAKSVAEFIKLQKNNTSEKIVPIHRLTFGKAFFRTWLVIFVILVLLELDKIEYGFTSIPMCALGGLIFSIIPAVIIYEFCNRRIENYKVNCPNCKATIGLLISSADEANGKMKCPNCNKELGIKHGYAYIITTENEFLFKDNKDTTTTKEEQPKDDTNNLSKYEELEKLKELLDKNIITQEEFDRKKEELLK